MAQIDEQRKAMESAFMAEYWTLRKEIGTPEDNEAYWTHVINRCNQLGEKYCRDPYLVSMILNLVHDLEARRGAAKQYGASIACFNQMRAKNGLPPVVEVM